MTKRDNYETLWRDLYTYLTASKDNEKLTSYTIARYMEGAEAALKKRLANKNYNCSYGLSYVMGQIRYASSMDTDSSYTFSDWVSLYETIQKAKNEFEATQIKWSDERSKWIFRKTSAKRGDIHTVLRNPYLTPKMQQMLCYMANNDLF
jgi:hypothetical protein